MYSDDLGIRDKSISITMQDLRRKIIEIDKIKIEDFDKYEKLEIVGELDYIQIDLIDGIQKLEKYIRALEDENDFLEGEVIRLSDILYE
jgi:hypothetical protein